MVPNHCKQNSFVLIFPVKVTPQIHTENSLIYFKMLKSIKKKQPTTKTLFFLKRNLIREISSQSKKKAMNQPMVPYSMGDLAK